MLSRAARPAIALARTANQQQAGMATLKEIEQRCVDAFGRREPRGKRSINRTESRYAWNRY